MKKKFALILLALACVLVLSACGCKHETWTEADCVTPKTCAGCGEVEGEPLGHSWLNADCDTPKTCEVCAATDGAPLGHSWLAADCDTPKTCEICAATDGEAKGHVWQDATCEAAKTCSVCKLTEGEALGHMWQAATTEVPKTCLFCGATDGERIITDPRFTTASTAEIQGTWACEIDLTGDMMGLENFFGTIACRYQLYFGNDGTLIQQVFLVDEEEFKRTMVEYYIQVCYEELELAGYNQFEADMVFKETYGMSIREYMQTAVNAIDIAGFIESMKVTSVYYVQDGKIYQSLSWTMDMEETAFSVDGDVLTIYDDVAGTGALESVLTRFSNPETV